MKAIGEFINNLTSWLFRDPDMKDFSATTIRRLVCCTWAFFLLLSIATIPFSSLAQEHFDSKIILHFYVRIILGIYFPVFLSFIIFWSHGDIEKDRDIRIGSEVAYGIVFVTLLCNIVIYGILLGCLFGYYPHGSSSSIPEFKPGLSFDLWILNLLQTLILLATVPLSRLLGVSSPICFAKKADRNQKRQRT